MVTRQRSVNGDRQTFQCANAYAGY